VVHSTAQNSSNDTPSYPPDNNHSSDDVYFGGDGAELEEFVGIGTSQVCD